MKVQTRDMAVNVMSGRFIDLSRKEVESALSVRDAVTKDASIARPK